MFKNLLYVVNKYAIMSMFTEIGNQQGDDVMDNSLKQILLSGKIGDGCIYKNN
jgi:hypothetical protein